GRFLLPALGARRIGRSCRQLVYESREACGGDQIVVATGAELQQVMQKPARLGNMEIMVQLQSLQFPPEEDPVIDFIQRFPGRRARGMLREQLVAKGVKGGKSAAPALLPELLRCPLLHLVGRLLAESQRQDVFRSQSRNTPQQ